MYCEIMAVEPGAIKILHACRHSRLLLLQVRRLLRGLAEFVEGRENESDRLAAIVAEVSMCLMSWPYWFPSEDCGMLSSQVPQ